MTRAFDADAGLRDSRLRLVVELLQRNRRARYLRMKNGNGVISVARLRYLGRS